MIPYIQHKRIDNNRIDELLNICKSKNHYTNVGPIKIMLEDKIGELINIPENKRVLCVTNGTVALHALMSYYNKKYDKLLKWVTPSFTFPSCISNTSNTIIVDIDPNTYTLSPEHIDDADGIIITNLFGTVIDFDILSIKNKIILYDNASSFLSTDNNAVNICLKGHASFGSLHHTKTLGFGEGGFIVIDDDMYDDMQALCGFGFRLSGRTPDVNASNYKMSDIAAAYILQHIEHYNINKHIDNQTMFRDNLKTVELFNDSQQTFFGNIPIIFNNPIMPEVFRVKGVEANKYYKPLADHINSNHLYERIINFPLNEDMTEEQIVYICNLIDANNL